MTDDLKNWLQKLGIHNCTECQEVIDLHKKKNISVAPLFWQGSFENGKRTPLIFLGGNPSLVNSPNEPKKGEDFDAWFDYYHNREQSVNKGGITKEYWEICKEYASCIFPGAPVKPWRDYVLLETTHCFFNREKDFEKYSDLINVSRECFKRYTNSMIQKLNPLGIIIFGDIPYNRFRERFRDSNGLERWKCVKINLHGFDAAVMRFYHPTGRHGHKNPPTSAPIFQDFGRMIRDIQGSPGK